MREERTAPRRLSRRSILQGLAAAPLVVVQNRAVSMPSTPVTLPSTPLLTRPIPSTGEALPVMGLGTWQTFDVGDVGAERAAQRTVLADFLRGGGRVIDSSPMYGRSEAVVGDLLAESAATAGPQSRQSTR